MLFRSIQLVALSSFLHLAQTSAIPHNVIYKRQATPTTTPPVVSVIGLGSIPLEPSTSCSTEWWGEPAPTPVATEDSAVIDTVIDGTTFLLAPAVTVTVTIGTDGQPTPLAAPTTDSIEVSSGSASSSSSTLTPTPSSSSRPSSSSSSSAPTSSASPPSQLLLNAQSAQLLNNQYTSGSFTSDQTCTEGQRACINGELNVCTVNSATNQFTYSPQFCVGVTSSGDPKNLCAAVPFVDGRVGTETGCFSAGEIEERFSVAGMEDGAPEVATSGGVNGVHTISGWFTAVAGLVLTGLALA